MTKGMIFDGIVGILAVILILGALININNKTNETINKYIEMVDK